MSNAVENLKLSAGANKPPIGIVPMHALMGSARVLEDSSVKYAPGNFMAQSVADAVESYDSAQLRHRIKNTPLSGLVSPESYASLDEDSGLPHIDHMITGLIILRTLLIRDGVLPEDPGQGKRKQAAGRTPIVKQGDPGYRAGGQPVEILPRTWDEAIAKRDDLRGFAAREAIVDEAFDCTDVECPYQDGDCQNCPGRPTPQAVATQCERCGLSTLCAPKACGDSTCPHKADPDAARRAAAEANIVQLEAEQRAATAAKAERDRKMSTLDGRARSEGMRW